MFFCQASSKCRRTKKVIPCANGSRSNVNKHNMKSRSLRGSQGAKRSENSEEKVGKIQASLEASKTFKVGKERCVCVHVCVVVPIYSGASLYLT